MGIWIFLAYQGGIYTERQVAAISTINFSREGGKTKVFCFFAAFLTGYTVFTNFELVADKGVPGACKKRDVARKNNAVV